MFYLLMSEEYNKKFTELRDIVDELDKEYGQYRLPGSPSYLDCLKNHAKRDETDERVVRGFLLWQWINKYQYDNYESLR